MQGRYDAVTVFDDDPAVRACLARPRPVAARRRSRGRARGPTLKHDAVRAIVQAFGPGDASGRRRGALAKASKRTVRSGPPRVVLGSAAVSDGALVRALDRVPGEDCPRRGHAGWARRGRRMDPSYAGAGHRPRALLRGRSLAGVLCTDVARDGTPGAPVRTSRRRWRLRLHVRTRDGIGRGRFLDDLHTLAARGIAACIVGQALYDRIFTLEEAVLAAATAAT